MKTKHPQRGRIASDVISAPEAAVLLGVPSHRIYKWLQSQKVSGRKVGYHWHVFRSKLKRPTLPMIVRPAGRWLTTTEAAVRLGLPRHRLATAVRHPRDFARKFRGIWFFREAGLAGMKAALLLRRRGPRYTSTQLPPNERSPQTLLPPPRGSIGLNQAAVRLGVSIQRVHQLVLSRRIRAVRSSLGWRIRLRDCKIPPRREGSGRPRKVSADN